jgi:Tfp pilus assembly protein PilX
MNQRGVALPVAMLIMALLTTLMLAFITLATSEPQIANNHLASAQARAMAEAGVERAIWALTKGQSNPGTTGSLADPLPATVPAPYNGAQYVSVGSTGGFTVTVTNGPGANERTVVAKGFTPNNTSPVAVRRIQVTITQLRFAGSAGMPLCALCGGGETPAGGAENLTLNNTMINADNHADGNLPAAAYCAGVTPQAAHMSTATTTATGNAQISDPPGQPGSRGNVPKSVFTPFTLTDTDIAAIKALAIANGTYFSGTKTFDGVTGCVTCTNPMPNGIVFVDTVSGNPYSSTTPDTDAAAVTVALPNTATWSGWLIVAGSINIPSGTPTLNGIFYALNDITINTLATINGAVVSANRRDVSTTNVDSQENKAKIRYDCPAIQNGGGAVPRNWWIKPGTFQEIAG